MTGVATPQEINVDHDGTYVLLTVQGGGTLRMPPNVAYAVARHLAKAADDVDHGNLRVRPTRLKWPNHSKR